MRISSPVVLVELYDLRPDRANSRHEIHSGQENLLEGEDDARRGDGNEVAIDLDSAVQEP